MPIAPGQLVYTRATLPVVAIGKSRVIRFEIGTGVLLIATGFLIFTNQLQIIAIWMLDMFPGLATIG